VWFWAVVLADIVTLKSGEKLDGWVRSYELKIEVAAGVIGVPWDEVESIDLEHDSSVEIYYQMREVLDKTRSPELEAFLARWCVERGLNRFVPRTRSEPAAFCKAEAPRPLKIVIAPTWVPPKAKIAGNGSIVYPANYIPGPTFLGLDALWLPYWQIPASRVAPEDFVRMRAEFSNEGLKEALIASRIVERERDILLIPLNEGNLHQWRLIYSLAPKQIALPVIRSLRGD
jgi:hypothetical protein